MEEGIELIEDTVVYNEVEANVVINFENPISASQENPPEVEELIPDCPAE